ALCSRIEPLDRSVNHIIEKRVINTDIYRTSFLPSYAPVIVITGPKSTGKLTSRYRIGRVVNARLKPPHILERRNALVSGNTISSPYLQIIHPGGVLHKILVG